MWWGAANAPKGHTTMAALQTSTTFEATLRHGIARDLFDIRTDLGLTLRAVTGPLGWAAAMELQRFENAKYSHNISLRAYIQLMRFYFERMPASTREDHPAWWLMNDPAVRHTLDLVRRNPIALDEYLAIVRGLVAAKHMTPNHPAERLRLRLLRQGGRAPI
jgi:hypothetical protein